MPPLFRLLYISDSCIDEADHHREVEKIIATAKNRNGPMALTGALLFTGNHFVQILEGPADSLDRMMASLAADHRHVNIDVIMRDKIKSRQFSGWGLAYHGPSKFVGDHVLKLLSAKSPSEIKRATEWLVKLAHEFSKDLAA